LTQNTEKQRLKVGLMLKITEGALEGRTPTFRDIQTQVQLAEQVNFDSIWLADHLIFRFPGRDEAGPWEALTLLSGLAAVTTRVTLGTLVVCTSFRPPALVAKMADTIDDISGGRFVLGLGAGWHQPEYDAFGYPFDHLAGRFEEALHIIRSLLQEEGQLDYEGRYYQVKNAILRPRGPSPKGPRLLIGAGRPRMLKLVARYADAWNTAWHTDSDVVKERYAGLLQACTEVGRDPSEIELTVGVSVRLSSAQGAGTGIASSAISGSPEEIASKLQAFADVGATHLIVSLDPLTPASIEEFGRIVELLR
jgi:alkanesulfonate monooxygenase SsuD/methylene tetrahydromethanopterin reductase-like flavin-dependent oxidoreductase (luciferase family)